MIQLAGLLQDEADFTARIQRKLCRYFCHGGRSCRASEGNDVCFCTEAGIVIAEDLRGGGGNK